MSQQKHKIKKGGGALKSLNLNHCPVNHFFLWPVFVGVPGPLSGPGTFLFA
jgi:hypothetical protein